ncbi:GNAT family N-acetyltransferase [Actinophytocola sp.]|jgi:ribosomal protein S18 acetylase RimI-like enzyme|uniref:GNAT family N-acetyltransferase n=1 Tax=Actinophytocola sp. TaxID=1872138 RepID=UPI002EDBB62F
MNVEAYRDTPEYRAAYDRLSERRLPGWPVWHHGADEVGDAFAFWAVRQGGELVGYADCGDIPGVEDPEAFHVWIVTDPDVAGTGAGVALLDRARGFARAHGRTALVTSVDQDDERANRWMASRGFEVHGESVGYELAAGPLAASTSDLTVTDGAELSDVDRRRVVELLVSTHNRLVFPGGGVVREPAAELESAYLDPGQCRLTVGWRDGEPVTWAAWADDEQTAAVLESGVADDDPADTAAVLAQVAARARAGTLRITASPQTHPVLTKVIRGQEHRVLAVRQTWRGGMVDRGGAAR